MEQLKELLTSGTWAAKKAEIALKLTEDYKSGQLSADEYKELCNDLLKTDQLNLQAEDLEIKAKLQLAITTLLKVI